MLKILETTLLGLFAVGECGYIQKLKDLESVVTHYGPSGMPLSHECADCYVDMCDITIQLPVGGLTCSEVNSDVEGMRDDIFKSSTQCQARGSEYICDVIVKPYKKLYGKFCNHDSVGESDWKQMYEESFCKANENCEDLSRCSIDFNIDCEYDANLLPSTKTPNSYEEGMCDEGKKEHVKRFFEDYWQEMVISSVISAMFSGVIIIIIICKKARVIVQQRSVV